MLFLITQEISEELIVKGISKQINDLSYNLNSCFEGLSLGNGLNGIYVSFICVSPDFDNFFKERNPKYVRGKEIVIQDGIPFEINSCLRYDYKADFNEVVKNNQILEAELKKAISLSIKLIRKSRITDFDIEKFEQILVSFLNRVHLV